MLVNPRRFALVPRILLGPLRRASFSFSLGGKKEMTKKHIPATVIVWFWTITILVILCMIIKMVGG